MFGNEKVTTTEEKAYKELTDFILERLKLDTSEYNASYIRRRVNSRLMVYGMPQNEFAGYLNILRQRIDEQRGLYDALTINVTQFFRDASLWDMFAREVLQKAVNEKMAGRSRPFTIWSCGCSSGEEPYTIAMICKEVLAGTQVVPRIVASDIDELSLQRAKAGVYDRAAFKTMPQQYLLKYFKQIKNDNSDSYKYEIDPAVKSSVQFVQNNFLADPPPLHECDMIFCRNVIIYFTSSAKEKLMNIFYNTLLPTGWLIIGKSEVLFTLKSNELFTLYNSEERIYRKALRSDKQPEQKK